MQPNRDEAQPGPHRERPPDVPRQQPRQDLSRDRPGEFGSVTAWIGSGLARRRRAIIWTYLIAYSALPLLIPLLVLLVLVRLLFGGGQQLTVDPTTGQVSVTAQPSLGSALGGLFASWVVGTLLGVVVVGGIAAVLLYGGLVFEPLSLRMRGYRRPTSSEMTRLTGAWYALREDMQLAGVPVIWVWDTLEPVAAARARSIVLSSALLALTADERGESLFRAVLAHEFVHWRRADYLADRAVWAVGWLPLLLYRLGAIAGGWDPSPVVSVNRARPPSQPLQRSAFGVLIGWMFLWPAWLIVRVIMLPLSMAAGRRAEYEADEVAALAGDGRYLSGLREFLTEVGSTDFAVAGWQAVLQRTHPPVALRLEALDDYAAEIAQQRSAAEARGRRDPGDRGTPRGEPDLGPAR